MGEYRFKRYLHGAEMAEGIKVSADDLDDACKKAAVLTYRDDRAFTVLVLDEAKVDELEAEKELSKNQRVSMDATITWQADIIRELEARIDKQEGNSDEN